MHFIRENSPKLHQKHKWALWMRHQPLHHATSCFLVRARVNMQRYKLDFQDQSCSCFSQENFKIILKQEFAYQARCPSIRFCLWLKYFQQKICGCHWFPFVVVAFCWGKIFEKLGWTKRLLSLIQSALLICGYWKLYKSMV
jgi:hypothetical protein